MDKLLTPDEVAGILQKTTKTLNNWRALGIGPPYVKLDSGSVLYREPDIEQWVKAQVVQTTVLAAAARA